MKESLIQRSLRHKNEEIERLKTENAELKEWKWEAMWTEGIRMNLTTKNKELKEENARLKLGLSSHYDFYRKAIEEEQIKFLLKERDDLNVKIGFAKNSLQRIAKWETPYEGFEWDRGSKGQAMYIRNIADTTLSYL